MLRTLPCPLASAVSSPPALLAASTLALALMADLGLLILLGGLIRTFARAPRLGDRAEPLSGTSLTVVVPAYNEAANIEACLASVLASADPCPGWELLVVDDRSTDATPSLASAVLARAEAAGGDGYGPADSLGTIGTTTAQRQPGPDGRAMPGGQLDRFRLLDAGPRPAGERWVGKNWACSRAMEQVESDWVLFIDADVRLAPDTLRRALGQAVEEEADLLSLAPRLACGCLAEWMVQPIMASLLGLGFPIEAANDPSDPTAFAAGPFMLFRRSAYEAIGGHRDLAGEVVEDLALARRIKRSGHRLRYLLGLDAVELRMYSDFASLWEGWSKNWFSGLDRSVARALGASAVVLLLFSGPWLLSVTAALLLLLSIHDPAGLLRLTLGAALAGSLLGIALQLALRLWTRSRFQVPLTLWWLMGAGGLVVGALGPVSVWRTLSGRGWTWKGRSLAG